MKALMAALKSAHLGRVSAIGAVVGALAASACCLLPALLALLGVSGLGLAAALEPYRPLFLLLTAGLLGAGFYLVYRRSPAPADPCDCPPPRARRSARATLWIASVVAVGVAAYPYLTGALTGTSTQGGASGIDSATTTRFRVDGMTCRACAKEITRSLADLAGVIEARVDYDAGTATVTFDPARVATTQLAAAIERLGYDVRP